MKFIRKQKQAHTKSSFLHRDYIRSHAESQRAQSIHRCRLYVTIRMGSCERSYAASVSSAALREKKRGICAKQKIRVQ